MIFFHLMMAITMLLCLILIIVVFSSDKVDRLERDVNKMKRQPWWREGSKYQRNPGHEDDG